MAQVSEYKGKRVLVLDGYGRQVPSVMKQLYELGCIITTLNESKLDVGYTSRYPKRKLVEHGIREDKELLTNVIERELNSGNYDIVFPMLEKSTDILNFLMADGKYESIKLIAAPQEAFMKAYNKQETLRTCMENGIPCPITKLDTETLDEYLKKVQFPLACKPRKGSGSAGFKKVLSEEELQNYIDNGTIKMNEYVIQEFIQQTEHMYGAYVLMNSQHEAVFTVVVETCRWFPINGGPGCYIKTVNRPDIVRYATSLLKALNWEGFGHIGFIMDPRDMVPKVMEINGRIPAGIKICDYAGMEPVKALLDRAYGKELQPRTKNVPEGLALRYFHTDFMWFIKSPNRFKEKPSWFDFRKGKDYIFSWKDPIPFFGYAVEHVLTYRKDMKKRQH